MPTIGWDESKPSDTDSLGQGDDEIRSMKTSLRVGLDGEHIWPSAGGDAGVHRLGSARAAFGTQSLVSSSGTDGRLMVTSDTSNFFHVGSTATSFIGGARVISAGSYPGTVPQRQTWVMEFGQGQTKASAVTDVSFPNSGFSAVPFLFVSGLVGVGTPTRSFQVIESVDASDFQVGSYLSAGGTPSNTSFYWLAIGLRTL